MITDIIDILEADADVAAAVGTRISAGRREQETALPAILLEVTSTDVTETKDQASKMDIVDFTATAFGETLLECENICGHMRDALDNFIGTQGSTNFQRISFRGQRHNFFNTDDDLYSWSYDFRAYIETSGGDPQYPPGATIDIINPDDSVVGQITVGKDIQVSVTATGVNNAVTPAVIVQAGASPADIAYKLVTPQQYVSYHSRDVGALVQLERYDRDNPAYPENCAKLDPNAEQGDIPGRTTPASGTALTDSVYGTILIDDNSFGNKLRFTDDKGNGCDATVGSNIWAHTKWIDHSFAAATDGYVIDHLLDIGMDINYLLDGTKYSLSNVAADGQSWSAWLDYLGTLGTHLGYASWMVPSVEEVFTGAHAAKMRGEPWAVDFFNAQRSDNRCGMLTGNTVDADSTKFWALNDSGDANLMLEMDKAVSGDFDSKILNIFLVRHHHITS